MNILISAYSCNPYLGSEDAVGWNWIYQYSKNASSTDTIYVITKRFNEVAMRKGIEEFGLNNVELWISEPPRYLDWFREKHSIFHHMYYLLWQKWAYKFVVKQNIKFDIIHHVTMTDWRFSGYFAKFKSSYTIFGPVGGGQEIPKCLKRYQKKRIMEFVRTFANKSRKTIPSFCRNINSFNAIYVVNKETQQYINEIVTDKSKVRIIPDVAIGESYKNIETSHSNFKKHKLLFCGRYDLPRKGAEFLVESLTFLPKNFEYSLDLYGGPEKCYLKKRITELGLTEKVHLCGKIPYTEMKTVYSKYDAFVFPSLRETGGNVLFEAMANGLPIVGFDTSLSSVLKEYQCGIFVPTECSLHELKEKFAQAILEVFGSNYFLYSNNAYTFANEETWDYKYKLIMDNYKEIHLQDEHNQ